VAINARARSPGGARRRIVLDIAPISRYSETSPFREISMAKVYPFQAYRYTPKAGPATKLVSQPYDKIPPGLQQQYYESSPYNVIRVIKGKSEASDNESNNVYTRAARTLEQWMAEGILAQDPHPGFYAYFQKFQHPDTGEILQRKGFIGLFELEEYEAGVIHRHELTHSGPKLDRLKLARHTHVYFEQLFTLYDDPDFVVDRRLDQAALDEPLLTAEEGSITHRVWSINDPAAVAEIQASMAPKKLLIADGHHRYETALTFLRENRNLPGAGKVMMTFVNMRGSGLVVLATHRVLDGLPRFDPAAVLERAKAYFDVERLDSSASLQKKLDSAPAGTSVIGAVFANGHGACLFTAKTQALAGLLSGMTDRERSLDVVILHHALLGKTLGISEDDVREEKNIRYIRGFQTAVEEVRSGQSQVAFLLRPVAVEEVAGIAFAGGVMPQKSTDFYPKLLSGLTMYRFG
jgi:uncharacterized protein (DUF1015 family)